MTAAHPFYSLTYGTWRYAGELEQGEQLLTQSGNVSVCDNTIASGTYKVYNVEVRQWHNFLVGEDKIVVHNNCVEDGDGNKGCLDAFSKWGEDINGFLPEKRKEHIGAYLDKVGNWAISVLANTACTFREVKINATVKEILQDAGKTVVQDALGQVKLQGDINGWYVMSEYAVEDIDLEQYGEKMRGRDNPNINPNTGSKYSDTYDYQSAVEGLKTQYEATDKADLQNKMTAKFGKEVVIENDGKIKIGGEKMVWHHHQNCRNMQLIPEKVHSPAHPGGNTLLQSHGFDNDQAKSKYPMTPLEIRLNLLCKNLTKK